MKWNINFSFNFSVINTLRTGDADLRF